MRVQEKVSLKDHSTMRLGGQAAYFCTISDKHELVNALDWADKHRQKVKIIGGGSNLVWSDDGFAGLVIVNQIKGFKVVKQGSTSYVTVGAGEDWDSVVERTVRLGLSGIEALSLIPGRAGATPVQNVGAYGQDVSQTLVRIEAYDRDSQAFITLQAEDCQFSYRYSRFKGPDAGRFFIVALTFALQRVNPRPPFYPAVANYLREHRINVVTPLVLRQAVIAIRSAKLPDPTKVANSGSFFGNPIVGPQTLAKLLKKYPDAPHWVLSGGNAKLSAAWLIDQAGFKNFRDKSTGMATWPQQPLVLVNEKAKKTEDLIVFQAKIRSAVDKKFGVYLENEPEIVEV